MYNFIKRLLDLVIATLALLLFSPFLIVIMLILRFSDEVEVNATNLNITCENLNLITRMVDNLNLSRETSLELERIEAVDNVLIAQKGRTSTSKRAFILPKESQVVLEGLAVVQDADGRVSGHRITLLQGQRRAIVEGGGPVGERARITLPVIPSQK